MIDSRSLIGKKIACIMMKLASFIRLNMILYSKSTLLKNLDRKMIDCQLSDQSLMPINLTF
jgi:hypothetical protein